MTVYWSLPISDNTVTGYTITYFSGAEDTTGTVVTVSGGSVSSYAITGLSSTIMYRVSIMSVGMLALPYATGPVLVARGKCIHSFPTLGRHLQCLFNNMTISGSYCLL